MRQPPTADADLLEGELFSTSGAHYLLAAFSQPRLARRPQLDEAATWLGLDTALREADPGANMQGSIETRWLALLGLCSNRLHTQADKRDLNALLAGLAKQYEEADQAHEPVKLDQLWKRANVSTTAALRGRRWIALRKELAKALSGLVAKAASEPLLPRKPREPRMFDDSSIPKIARLLREASGMLVIADAPGSGRSELALAYAHDRWREHEYDRVFVLRGMDPLRLEQDYLTMASLLTGDFGDRGSLRRHALDYLEGHDGWLIVFLSVSDPSVLLPVLPWQNRGHILCTTSADPPLAEERRLGSAHADRPEDALGGEPSLREGPWEKYFSVRPVVLDDVADFNPRKVFENEFPVALHRDPCFERLVREVGRSRFSIALALAWFSHTCTAAHSEGLAEISRAQIEGYLGLWDQTARGGQGNGTGGASGREAAIRAAEVQLRELRADTRWRSSVEREDARTEQDAFELLCRLQPFVGDEQTAATFQTVLLDHPDYGNVPDRIEDKRLQLITRLGLADLHNSPVRRYFHVNAAVLQAVSGFEGAKGSVASALQSAFATLLRLLSNPPAGRDLADLTFELLPHIQALAGRARSARMPLISAELHGYAALSYLTQRRPRHAEHELDEVKALLNDLREEQAGQETHWNELGKQPRPDEPLKRMGKLVKALRTAGFQEAAAGYFDLLRPIVDGSAVHDLPVPQRQQVARLWFEASMAYHDLDDLGKARGLLDRAWSLWAELGPETCELMGQSFAAELAFDGGDAREARRMAEAARESRVRLLDESDSAERSLRLADIARSDYLLGRIDYVDGRFGEARDHLVSSVEGWDESFEAARSIAAAEAAAAEMPTGDRTPHPSRNGRLNQIIARSYLALIRGLLGERLAAQEDADHVQHEMRTTPPRSHTAAVIASNVAQVYRLCGRLDEAVQIHKKAISDAARAWPTRPHRTERLIRRKYADSLLDAGHPTEALEVLMGLLRKAPPTSSPGPTWRVGSARILSSLGRLFIENSLSLPPLLETSAKDLGYLDVTQRVLTDARLLFETSSSEQQAVNPAILGCLLGLTEVAIRRQDAGAALALADAALERGMKQYGGASPIMTTIARRARAQALAVGGDADALRELKSALESCTGDAAGNPSDGFEVALATVDLRARLWLLEPDRTKAADLLEELRKTLAVALERYLSISPGQKHQLSARIYAELAALAPRLGLPEQRRARLVRECERVRPPFSVNTNDLLYEIAGRLHVLSAA